VIRLAVFDLDGTIADSAPQILAAMRRGFAAVGLPAPDDRSVLSLVGLSLPTAVSRLVPEVAAGARAEIVVAYRAAFLADPVPPQLYPDAASMLRALREDSGLSLAIASGKTRRGIERVLRQHGLAHLFASLHGGDGHPSKPDPAMLRAAMRAAGVEPEETVLVGDSPFDIEMARNAGVPAIGVAWGYGSAAALRACGAVAIATAFRDLPGLLARVRAAA
jgi:phosphoglycolate phosphatase